MPIKKASAKDLRKSRKNADRNRGVRSRVKQSIKEARAAVTNKTADAEQKIQQAVRLLDRAASKKVIKKNTAARKKSRLWKSFSAVNASSQK